jgi:hypothetical protein
MCVFVVNVSVNHIIMCSYTGSGKGSNKSSKKKTKAESPDVPVSKKGKKDKGEVSLTGTYRSSSPGTFIVK